MTACAEKPATVSFYQEKLQRLLADSQVAGLRLNAIDEAVIDAYKQRRTRRASRYGRPVQPASVNRELATLRRLLRLAQEWKVLDRVPRIRLLRGERNREFVLSQKLEPVYLGATPEPLKDVALLMIDTGVRVGEAVVCNGQTFTCNRRYMQNSATLRFGRARRRTRNATSH
jgi:site-specific recombinase XerD